MLFRFCLYGFLKNQRYFEPFLVLLLREKGFSFLLIGILIAFRELCVNLMEIPSGAAADVGGRRRSMVAAFLAYIASFVTFALAREAWAFFPAMFLFAIGDAFRSGAHKAMIFTWLRIHGREAERTRIYGYTRSWSKIGSAVSALVAAALVFASDSYERVFLYAALPYVANVINLATYPRVLDGDPGTRPSLREMARLARDSLRDVLTRPALRGLVVESMGFEGTFHAVKDYIQPVLAASALVLLGQSVADAGWSEAQRSALLIGPVYFALHLASGFASRQAHRVRDSAGGDDAAAGVLWIAFVAISCLLFAGGLLEVLPLAVGAFVLLHVAQNLWRPILVSRFDTYGEERKGATLLSIESQARRLATLCLAPLVGFAVDAAGAGGPAGAWWPIGAVGLMIGIPMAASQRRRARHDQGSGVNTSRV